MELIEKLIEEGYTDVIMYSISYQLSSIGQMVETLREEYGKKINIHVVDTKVAAYLQGYITITAKDILIRRTLFWIQILKHLIYFGISTIMMKNLEI